MSGNQQQRHGGGTFRWALSITCLYAVAALALLPGAARSGPEMPAITPFVVGGILVAEWATCFLLLIRFRDLRTLSSLVLGSAYLWSSIMAFAHLLTFPDAVLPGTVFLGTWQSAPWTFQLWTNGFAGLALAAILLEAHPATRVRRVETAAMAGTWIAFVCVAAIIGVIASTALVEHMPALMRDTSWTMLNSALNATGVAMMAAGIALVFLVLRGRDALYAWLGLALTSMFLGNILALAGGGRYTVGWTAARLNWVTSAGILFLFFMSRFASQQRRLAQAQATLERRVAERTADLTRTVAQRDLLLREVYHRVKNNLQVVNSLILMESRRLEDPTAKAALADLRNRVYTLGLVHQQLMASENLAAIAMAPFLRDLADNVAASFNAADGGVAVAVRAEPLSVGLDFAISVGLLATELLSNALKHARASTVTIAFGATKDGTAVLSVRDNGADASAGAVRLASRTGVGSRIIEGLTRQLDGTMAVSYDDGMRIEIHMKLPELA